MLDIVYRALLSALFCPHFVPTMTSVWYTGISCELKNPVQLLMVSVVLFPFNIDIHFIQRGFNFG